MIPAIQIELAALAERCRRLDSTLAGAPALPDLEAALGLVELNKVVVKLDKVAARLESAAARQAAPGSNPEVLPVKRGKAE
jgi:hypothetical protein